MAVISTYTQPTIQGWSADGTDLRVSTPAAAADSVQLTGLPWHLPHCFLSVKTYSDAAGTLPVTAGAGVATITVRTVNCQAFEAITDGPTITMATPTTSSWDGNTEAVNVAMAGLTVAVSWRVFLTMNR